MQPLIPFTTYLNLLRRAAVLLGGFHRRSLRSSFSKFVLCLCCRYTLLRAVFTIRIKFTISYPHESHRVYFVVAMGTNHHFATNPFFCWSGVEHSTSPGHCGPVHYLLVIWFSSLANFYCIYASLCRRPRESRTVLPNVNKLLVMEQGIAE